MTIFEHPDVLDLAGLHVVLGPEPDGTVGAVFEFGDLVTMTPAEARALSAALAKAANDTEALTATG